MSTSIADSELITHSSSKITYKAQRFAFLFPGIFLSKSLANKVCYNSRRLFVVLFSHLA